LSYYFPLKLNLKIIRLLTTVLAIIAGMYLAVNAAKVPDKTTGLAARYDVENTSGAFVGETGNNNRVNYSVTRGVTWNSPMHVAKAYNGTSGRATGDQPVATSHSRPPANDYPAVAKDKPACANNCRPPANHSSACANDCRSGSTHCRAPASGCRAIPDDCRERSKNCRGVCLTLTAPMAGPKKYVICILTLSGTSHADKYSAPNLSTSIDLTALIKQH
jgi:hypothetical protein